MNRKYFLKSLALTTGFSIVNPSGVLELFAPVRDLILPFPRGVKKKVIILAPKQGLFNEVSAQHYVRTPYGYHTGGNYNSIAAYGQWYAHQQAVAQWNSYVQQQQQYYNWLQANQMQYLLQQYSSYQQIGPPSIWEHVRSVYAFAKNYNTPPVLFGLNRNQNQVATQETLEGASNVWEEVADYYGKKEAQKTVAPQTSEKRAKIKIPNNIFLNGNGYETDNGALAVSDELVETEDGEVGNLVKYQTGPDGEEYMIV
jgi:hypothetical protein